MTSESTFTVQTIVATVTCNTAVNNFKTFVSSVMFYPLLHSIRRITNGPRHTTPFGCVATFEVNVSLWRVNGRTECEPFTCTPHQRPAQGWKGLKYRLSNLRHDPNGNRTRLTSFGGTCSTNRTRAPVKTLTTIKSF